jgi:predicted alpha/beta hydrolase
MTLQQQTSPTTEHQPATPTETRIPARDGYPLAASVFASTSSEPSATVLIGSATGVPRAYYARFARFLASRAFDVVTYDYRGVGGSAPRRLRGFHAKMSDWGKLDLDGALDWTLSRFPERPLLYVGHSVAGQLLGLASAAQRLSAAWLVGSQSGYWRLWDGAAQVRAFAYWHAILPSAAGLLGYFPARLMGGGEDLPAGVAREWAAWGRHPQYILGHHASAREGYARLAFPITMVSISDDDFAPRRAVDTLGGWFGAFPSRRLVHPEDVGAKSLGHFGYFRERFASTLWNDCARWLATQVEGSAR